jgi:putative DNA primase/helicase
VHGPQGTGKSRFFEAVAKIYGEYGIVLNQGAIEDKFNSDWTSRKLFILADEIVARQDMYHLKNQLKAFITGDWVRVNPKNLAAYKERNHMNLVFLSNENQPVALENDDRRHCVIYTPQKLDESFYNEVSEEIDNGGVEALFHLLLNYDLGDFKPWTKPPATKAKMDLININRDSVDSFLIDWREGDLDLPFCPCRSAKLYQAYASWCRRTGERFPRNDRHFMAYIEKLPGWYRGHKNTYENLHYSGVTKRSRVVIPSVADMEKAAKCGLKDYRHNSANQTETQWVTDCVFAFDNAMSKGAEQ